MSRKLTTEDIIARSKSIYGEFTYDYSKTVYVDSKTHMTFICHIHKEFHQTKHQHLGKKTGCKRCSKKIKKVTFKEFLRRSKEAHGDTYDYSKSEQVLFYGKGNSKRIIICRIHGEFKQNQFNHMKGYGCQRCFLTSHSNLEAFSEKANKVHEFYYTYIRYYYNPNKKSYFVDILCPKHGQFSQKGVTHMEGRGCKQCGWEKSRTSIRTSKKEIRWLDILNIPNDNLHRMVRLSIEEKVIFADGFDPQTNTVYEFYGDYWHGNPKVFNPNDINKITKCSYKELYNRTMKREAVIKRNGYTVIAMWESDFDKLYGKLKR